MSIVICDFPYYGNEDGVCICVRVLCTCEASISRASSSSVGFVCLSGSLCKAVFTYQLLKKETMRVGGFGSISRIRTILAK